MDPLRVIGFSLLALLPSVGAAQTALDLADPSLAREAGSVSSQAGFPVQQEQNASLPDVPEGGPYEMVAGAILVQGSTVLPQSLFSADVERFLGRPLDRRDLSELAGAIAATARRKGYGLSTAWVPAQSLNNGILIVRLEEGAIADVRASGSGAAIAAARLSGLAKGNAVATRALERAWLIARDIPGMTVGEMRLARSSGSNILEVDAKYDRFQSSVSLDNWGNDVVGPLQAYFDVNVGSLMSAGDRLTLNVATNPTRPEELQLARISYSFLPDVQGTSIYISGYVAATQPGGALRQLDYAGKSGEIRVGVSRPLLRSRAESLWLGFDAARRWSTLKLDDTIIRRDEVTSAAAWLYGIRELAGIRTRANFVVTQGLDLGRTTAGGDPRASRPNADGVFTRVYASASFQGKLEERVNLEIGTIAQIASSPLLLVEELGLGGRAYLRAFDYREASGTRGAAAMAEIRYDLPKPLSGVRWAQLFGFVDGGKVSATAGYPSSWLSSAGGGLRIWTDHRLETELIFAAPLTLGADGRKSNPRVSFVVTKRL